MPANDPRDETYDDLYFATLAQQIHADNDPMPQVVARIDIDGHTIRVIDVTCTLDDDQPVLRGFLYVAVDGRVELHPAHRDRNAGLCRIDGTLVAASNISATDAIDRARTALTALATTS